MSKLNTSDFQKVTTLEKDIPNELCMVEMPLFSSLVDNFTEQDFIQIIKQMIEYDKVKDDYCTMSSFLEGKKTWWIDLTKELEKRLEAPFEQLKDLDFSFRFTNVQNCYAPLKEVCNQLQKLNLPTTVNMYVTPNANSNCFTFHSDYQETIITQLRGSKQWFFPQSKDGKRAIYITNTDVPQKYPEIDEFVLEQGKVLSFGQCFVHKAHHIGDEISIHLTFAIYRKNLFDFLFMISKDLFKTDESVHDLLVARDLNTQQFSDVFNRMIQSFSELDLQDYIKKFKRLDMKEEIELIKKGRIYPHEIKPKD